MERRYIDASNDISERDIINQRWKEMQDSHEYYNPARDIRDFMAGIGLFLLIIIAVGAIAYVSIKAEKEHTLHKTYNHGCKNSE